MKLLGEALPVVGAVVSIITKGHKLLYVNPQNTPGKGGAFYR